MDIKQLKETRDELKEKGINVNDLYIYDCVQASLNLSDEEFTEEDIEDICNEVDYLWLEDETGRSISTISDFVVTYAKELKDMDKWEKLDLLADY